MVSTDRTKIHLARATLLVGAAGATPAVAVGHRPREGGVACEIGRASTRFYSVLRNLAIARDNAIESIVLRTGFWQVDPTLLGYALGFAADGNLLALSSSTAMTTCSVKVTGDLLDGTDFSCTSLLAMPHEDMTLLFSEKEIMTIPFVVDCLAPDSGNEFEWLLGTGNLTATIDTGVLTRVISEGYHKVAGADGAADDLDSITAADLVDDEKLRLQIATAGVTITLKHLNDTLELTSDVDWAMDSIYDWIDLQYDETGSKWVEIQRYDHLGD